MEKALLIQTPPLDVYEQMAADEYFCQTMPKNYILRFFNWKEEGITFGFSQRYNQVIESINESDRKIPITRRPTGGGIVFHKTDLTFSFIFYSPEEFNPYKTYEKLHSALNESFSEFGFSFEILNSKTQDYKVNNPAMNCFNKPVEKDLLMNGKKVLGGALRKFSDFMLYQASFQAEKAREDKNYNLAIIKAFEKLQNIKFKEYIIDSSDFENIKKIAYNKYRTENWIKRI